MRTGFIKGPYTNSLTPLEKNVLNDVMQAWTRLMWELRGGQILRSVRF